MTKQIAIAENVRFAIVFGWVSLPLVCGNLLLAANICILGSFQLCLDDQVIEFNYDLVDLPNQYEVRYIL